MIAWILSWASVNNGVAVTAWYLTYVTFFVQDLFVYISFEVYIIYVLAVEAVRAQLQRIDRVLNSVVINKLDNDWVYSDKDVTIVQHFSATCRAARSKQLCRLPSAQILMRIDDIDARKCAEIQSDNQIGILDRILFFIPAIFARFDDWMQELYINLMVPIIWTCFIVSNCYLFSYFSYVANIVVNLILIILPLLNPMVIEPARRRQLIRNKTSKQDSIVDIFDYIVLKILSDSSVKVTTSSVWANMNRPIQDKNSKFKFDGSQGLNVIDESITKPPSIPKELLALRMSKWSEYWETNIKLDKHYNSTAFLNKILWNTESIHEQHLGGDLQGLLYHYLRAKAKNVSSEVTDIYEALRIAENRFHILDKSGKGSLTTSEATRLANYLWTIYDINGTALSKDEWIDMAEFLAINVLSFQNQRIAFNDFKIWALETYEDIIKKRQLAVRDKVVSRLPPPKQGPTHIFDNDDRVVSDEHPNVTADKEIAINHICEKFDELDEKSEGYLDSYKLLYLADWTWSWYYPNGQKISDDERVLFREKLSSAIFKHSTYKLSVKSFIAWLEVSELCLTEKRNEIRKKKMSLTELIISNISELLKTNDKTESKLHINLFPIDEPHDVGHVQHHTIPDLFPSPHNADAIPETPKDDTIEAMIRAKENIISNMQKYEASSSSESDDSPTFIRNNPMYEGESTEQDESDFNNTENQSYISSKFSVLSSLSHIPDKPHLPHHKIHNPSLNQYHQRYYNSDDDINEDENNE